MTSSIFELYDSHNKPIEGAQATNEKPKQAFETQWQEFRRKYGSIGGRAKLLMWFFTKHGSKLVVSAALIIAVYHIATNFMSIMKTFSSTVSKSFVGEIKGKNNKTDTTESVKEPDKPAYAKIVGIMDNCIITESGEFLKKGIAIMIQQLKALTIKAGKSHWAIMLLFLMIFNGCSKEKQFTKSKPDFRTFTQSHWKNTQQKSAEEQHYRKSVSAQRIFHYVQC